MKGNYANRVVTAFKEAAQRSRTRTVGPRLDPQLELYRSMINEDFEDMQKEYGMNAVLDYIKEMETLGFKSGGR